jgi:hypothetical protein
MRSIVSVVACGVLALAAAKAARADDQADLRKVIDKAMKAMGGEEKLGKYKAHTWKGKGKYYGMGDGVDYTASGSIQFPDQYRLEIENVFTLVLNKGKGWVVANGQTTEMDKDQLEEQKEELYANWVTSLVPLKDKAYKLTAVGDAEVDKRPAVGIKVSRAGHQDINLFFDKDTGLLVKTERRVKAREQGGMEVNQETWMSDYKDVEGIKVALKFTIKRDGKLFVEGEDSDLKLLEKLDDSVFAKP